MDLSNQWLAGKQLALSSLPRKHCLNRLANVSSDMPGDRMGYVNLLPARYAAALASQLLFSPEPPKRCTCHSSPRPWI
jgi:hypothetical protein